MNPDNDTINVKGQTLQIIYMHGIVHIKHPDFLASGSGDSMNEAKNDLQLCCKALLDKFPQLIPPVYDEWVEEVATSKTI